MFHHPSGQWQKHSANHRYHQVWRGTGQWSGKLSGPEIPLKSDSKSRTPKEIKAASRRIREKQNAFFSQMLNVWYIYLYIYLQNYPNVGK